MSPLDDKRRDEAPSCGAEWIGLETSEGNVISVMDGDVVGRSSTGKEILEAHEEISRRHAQFIRDSGKWHVVDLNSSNGTFLDGERLIPRKMTRIDNLQKIRLSPVCELLITIREPKPEPENTATSMRTDSTYLTETNRRTMVILFGDLKGSVDFYQEKGTIVARNWILNLFNMLHEIITAHGGKHLKDIGDAMLAVFDDAHEAVKAAEKMQHAISEHNRKTDKADHYSMRIGMNIGSVIYEDNDVFGNAVNIASRIQDITPPGRIFISDALYGSIVDFPDVAAKFAVQAQLKGVRGKTGVYELLTGNKKVRDTKQL